MLCFMSHIASKVASDNDVPFRVGKRLACFRTHFLTKTRAFFFSIMVNSPCGVVFFIKFFLNVCSNVLKRSTKQQD